MKQRAITFVIILIVFLSIFSANYEVLSKLRSSEILQSNIFTNTEENNIEDQAGICDDSSATKTINFISKVTSEVVSINY